MKIAPFDIGYATRAARRLIEGSPVTTAEYNAIISALAVRSDLLLGGTGRKAIFVLLPTGLIGNGRIVGELQPNLDEMLFDETTPSRLRTEAALYIFDVASALRTSAYSAQRPAATPAVAPVEYAAVYGPFADKIIDNPNLSLLVDPQEADEAFRILSSSDTQLLAQRGRYLQRSYGRSSVTKVLELGVTLGGGLLVAASLVYVIAGRKIDARKAEKAAQEKSFGLSRMA